MSIDTTEIGIVAAKVMEDIEEMVQDGDWADDTKVIAAFVVYEVRSESQETTTVGARVTHNSSTIALGLMERMRHTMTHSSRED